jgi:hypothetical protein
MRKDILLKFSLILAFFLNVFSSFSQLVLPNYLDSNEQKLHISFRSSHDIQSTSLQNELMFKFIQGGLISKELINTNSLKHNEINRLGREFTNEIKFITSLPFKKLSEWNFLSEVNYNSIFSSNYSGDLFKIVFQGNQSFIGDTAKFSGTNFNFIDFQTFGLGLSHKKSKSNFSLNLVNVQNYLSSTFSDAELIFAQDSSDINVNLAGDLNSTFSSKFNKGLGIALNFTLNISVPWKEDNNAFFQFQVRNFGFAKINQINRYQVDTIISYAGFNLDELLNFDQSIFDGTKWQDTLNVSQDTISKFILLPAMIQFGKVLKSNYDKNLQSFFGVKMFPSLRYVPKVYAGIDYKITEKFHSGFSFAYGGFGNFRAGLYANYLSDKINVGIGTEDMYGLISKKGFGQMLSINFQYKM